MSYNFSKYPGCLNIHNEILGMLFYVNPHMRTQVVIKLLSYRMAQTFKYRKSGILQTFRTYRRGMKNSIKID
jgi:hypothetical protein